MSFLLTLLLSMATAEDMNLRSLKDVSTKSIDLSTPSLFMIFQKDCEACHKQAQQLSCVDVPIYLIGAFATEKALRYEYKKMKTKYQAFMGTKSFLLELGVESNLTPQIILIGDSNRHKFVGLTDCQKIKTKKNSEAKP